MSQKQRPNTDKRNSNDYSIGLSSYLDSDSDSDDEVLSFPTRKFVAKENVCTNNLGSDSDSSSSDDSILKRRAGRILNSRTIKSKHNGKFVAKRQANTLHLDLSSSSSSSSDSDVSMTNNDSRKRSKSHLVTMLDSDSDDDTASLKLDTSLLSQESNRYPSRNRTTKNTSTKNRIASSRHQRKDRTESNSDPKTADIMKKAKEAQEKLLMAQNYQADDLDLSIELNDDDHDHHASIDDSINDDEEPKKSIHAPNTSIRSLQPPTGPSIKISLRTNITSNSKSQDESFTLQGNKTFFRIQQNDKMQTLLQNYKSKFCSDIPSNADIKFSFDGEILKLNQTPKDLDMENEDLIDVLVKWPNTPIMDTSINTLSTTQHNQTLSNESVIITTRIKGGDRNITHKYQLRKRDGFTKLAQAYREKQGYSSFKTISLFYRGEELDLNSSPDLEDMPRQVDIEIEDETERENQLKNGQPLTCSSKVIQLKIRQNGNDKTVQKYSIGLSEKFNGLVNNYLRRNKLTMAECEFIFEGESLNLQGTPDDEELEGDEIIDVQISSKKSSSTRQVTKTSNKPHIREPPQKNSVRNEMIISLSSDSESDDHDSGSDYHDAHEYIEELAGDEDDEDDDDIIIVTQPETRNTRKSTRTQSRIGNYFSAANRNTTSKSSTPTIDIESSSKSPIVIQTYRNNMTKYRPKSFKLFNTDSVMELKTQYIEYYKAKGCRSVRFYFNNELVADDQKSFESLGLSEKSIFHAIENDNEFLNTS